MHADVERTGTCVHCGVYVEWIPLSMGGWGAPVVNPSVGSHAWTVECGDGKGTRHDVR